MIKEINKELIVPCRNLFNRFISTKTGAKTVLENKFLGKRKFFCTSSVEAFRTLKYGDEESALGAFLFLLRDDDVLWDIGASIGLYSIYAAEKVQSVYSFEPDLDIYNRFNENIGLNNLQNKITSFQCAIGGEKGQMELYSDGINGYSPSLKNLERHKGNMVKVDVKSIDSLLSEEKLATPTVMKIDIEGAEILALKGAKKLLGSPNRPRILFIEVHPGFLKSYKSNIAEIENLLLENSYHILSTQQRDDQFHLVATS